MTTTRLDFRFQPVAAHTAGAEIAVIGQLVLAIRSGAYRKGDLLPSARELANTFGVSLGTISAAVKLLEGHGLVKSVRGNQGGTRVLRDDIPPALLELISRRSPQWRAHAHAELVDARRAIEIPLAALAAANATTADFEVMETCLNEMRAARLRNDIAGWTNADLRFHYAMGHAARSSVLAKYQHEVLTELALLIKDTDEFEDAHHVINMHLDLLGALRSRDDASARSSMEKLIELAAIPKP
ncbi:FCD domain-containing protein [Lentzea sp. NPDC051208]|uniref:FadR/GntR family transcriptional regulator n=1 Tax=Lentzea sp. NPDC051208 TaxID=3154642 RepID=UPI00341AA3EF